MLMLILKSFYSNKASKYIIGEHTDCYPSDRFPKKSPHALCFVIPNPVRVGEGDVGCLGLAASLHTEATGGHHVACLQDLHAPLSCSQTLWEAECHSRLGKNTRQQHLLILGYLCRETPVRMHSSWTAVRELFSTSAFGGNKHEPS